MRGSSPYRIAPETIASFAPGVEWTRWVSRVLAAASLVIPAVVVRDLVADEDCKHVSTPHWDAALGVTIVVPLAILLGLFLQRRAASWVRARVRVRSSISGALFASATLIPVLVVAAVVAFACAWIDFAYTWDLCLDLDWTAFASIFHC